MFLLFAVVKYINILCIFFVQLSSKRETCGDKSRQLRDAQQDARDKVEVKYWQAKKHIVLDLMLEQNIKNIVLSVVESWYPMFSL